MTSTNNVGRLRSIATELLIKFSRVGLGELDQRLSDVWAKESYAIAVKIAYENGNLRGTPRDRLGIAVRTRPTEGLGNSAQANSAQNPFLSLDSRQIFLGAGP